MSFDARPNKLYDTAVGKTAPDFVDLHCGLLGCKLKVFESKNVAHWDLKQFLQYTKEALVAAKGNRLGGGGTLNIVVSETTVVNRADFLEAQQFYGRQFFVGLKLWRIHPSRNVFTEYDAAPNDLPLRYVRGAGWQFAESGAAGVDGMAADGFSSSGADAEGEPDEFRFGGGGGGGE
jgi:hypothetical protein